ncbi:unnamed protein product, partial [Nesidiocoris tenuis]
DSSNAHVGSLAAAGQLLCDVHHSHSVTRRDLLALNVDTSVRDTLLAAPIGEFLFSDSLDDQIKASKELEKASQQLKPVKRPSQSSLNFRGPSRQQGVGGAASYQKPPARRLELSDSPSQGKTSVRRGMRTGRGDTHRSGAQRCHYPDNRSYSKRVENRGPRPQ